MIVLVLVTMMLIQQTTLFTPLRCCNSYLLNKLDPPATLPSLSRLPGLHYGVEMAYLFPFELYQNVTDYDVLIARKENLLKEMAATLREAGVPARFFEEVNKVSMNQWKLGLERSGFEVASPLSPPFEHIERLVKVMKDFGCWVHPRFTLMHINVDARNRTVEETRNVYKNIISVEPALDMFRIRDPFELGGRAKELGAEFGSVQEAYASLDSSESFQSHIELGKSKGSDEGYYCRHRYRVGLKLDEDEENEEMISDSFEFRLWQPSMDPAAPVAWIKLATSLVEASYSGHVLPPVKKTAEEAWSVLFNELVKDSSLEEFFLGHRKTFDLDEAKIDSMNAELCRREYW
eukprot:CAMPEP_0198151966 /NCGR_PEP_ID=MMETSP1443-20131203/57885_1 /TAXON_ID=186043 /ORGANISM="Entomoneis sp., Strain CCMP2396" /LENGTH=347 /DNA_ID=CAMNT_0043817829 /DNA_START=172 /DNA_END=1212 /DNA_ORIENTATION=+